MCHVATWSGHARDGSSVEGCCWLVPARFESPPWRSSSSTRREGWRITASGARRLTKQETTYGWTGPVVVECLCPVPDLTQIVRVGRERRMEEDDGDECRMSPRSLGPDAAEA